MVENIIIAKKHRETFHKYWVDHRKKKWDAITKIDLQPIHPAGQFFMFV